MRGRATERSEPAIQRPLAGPDRLLTALALGLCLLLTVVSTNRYTMNDAAGKAGSCAGLRVVGAEVAEAVE